MAVLSALSAHGQKPFRFLDLPKGLRFIVYELLSTPCPHRLVIPSPEGCVASTFTYTFPPIHLICKTIHNETSSIVARHRKRVSTLRMALEFTPLETANLNLEYFKRCLGLTMRLVSRIFRCHTAEEVPDAWWMQHNQTSKADLMDIWDKLHDHPCDALQFALYRPINADEEEMMGLFDPSHWHPIQQPPGVEFWHTRELTLSVHDAPYAPAAIELMASGLDEMGQIYHGVIDGEHAAYLYYTAT